MSNEKIWVKILVRSWFLWLSLALLFAIVTRLAIYTPPLMGKRKPNVLLFLFAPPIFMLGATVLAFGTARVIKRPVTFLETLVTIVSAYLIMQFGQILQ